MNPTPLLSESEIVHSILLAWGAHPSVRLSRQNVGKALIRGYWVKFGVPGTADVVGLIAPSGRLVMLECKTLKGKQRAAQIAMMNTIRAFGGVYEVCRSLLDADLVFASLGIYR